jgi:uncharacterized protein (TIGR02996 family)
VEEGLFWSILEDPHNDQDRLVYADWLEEHGCAQRATFIRLQVHWAAELVIADIRQVVTAPLGVSLDPFGLLPELQRLAWLGVEEATFRRGFVECVGIRCGDLWDNAKILFRHAPLLEVHLIDREPLLGWQGRGVGWIRSPRWRECAGSLPSELWELLPAQSEIGPFSRRPRYRSKTAAMVAAMIAAVRFGREQADLCPLE